MRGLMSAAHGTIELSLLGPARIWRGDVEFPLHSARHTAVLCVLALHPGRAVGRDELVAAVWGDQAPPTATGSVYTYVSTLRHMLEPARDRWAKGRLLSSTGGTYRLNIDPQSVDVTRFDALRQDARRHRATGSKLSELAAVEAALRMWHGEALAGVPGPFAQAQRARLGELRLAAAERHAVLLAETGRRDDAVRALHALAAEHPTRDSLHATLTRLLRDAGRVSTRGKRPDVPVVAGRSAEIQRVRRAVARATAGQGGSLLIEGTPGMGRSALLAAALRDDATTGCRIGRAAGGELSRRMRLGVLTECLASAALDTGKVSGLLDTGAPDSQIVAEVADLVSAATSAGPLILSVDDLPRADPLTLGVWAALSQRAGDLPLLLIATGRAGAPETAGRPAGDVIRLKPLDAEAATALVRARETGPTGDRELRRMLGDAGGNPSYLTHLVAGPAEEREALTSTVRAHLAEFPEDTRRLLRAAALLGAYEVEAQGPAGCTAGWLAAATGHTLDEVRTALAPVVAAGMLADDGVRLYFPCPVVAEVLHKGTPAVVRAALHQTFAQRIAATGGPPELVVRQLLAEEVTLSGADADWFAGHLADLAEREPALTVTMLRRACVQRSVSPARRLEFTAWLARLLSRLERNAAVEAGWAATRTADPELEGEMRWVMAVSHERRGDAEAAGAVIRAALREGWVSRHWQEELRAVLARLRPLLDGEQTEPRFSRAAACGDGPAADDVVTPSR